MSIGLPLKSSFSARRDFDFVTTNHLWKCNAVSVFICLPVHDGEPSPSYLKKDARGAKFFAKIKPFRAIFSLAVCIR